MDRHPCLQSHLSILGGFTSSLTEQALGRLDALTTLLPDTQLFLYLYVRKEALLSSQIEGTKSSFSDLLLFENEGVPGVPIDDVEEVSNYVAAMQHGLRRIKGGFPLSLRLIREKFFIFSKRTGKRSERWAARLRQAWPFTNTYKHIH